MVGARVPHRSAGMLDGWSSPPLAFPLVVKPCTWNFRRHAWHLGAFAGVAALLVGTLVPAAAADAIASKQAQAQALANQIHSLGRREAALSEQYDKAQLDAQAAANRVRQAAQKQDAADALATRAHSAMQLNAVDAYVHGGSLAVVASRTASPTSLGDGGILRSEYVKSLAATQADALDQFHLASQQSAEARAEYRAAQLQATAAATQVNLARNAAVAAQQRLEGTLAKVKGDLQVLVAQAQAAKAAAEAAAAQAALARQAALLSQTRGIAPVVLGPPPPVSSGAGAAVAAAESRLGAPYVWGAAGPNAFDCSGLVMWAWGRAGVSLPHFSGAQYSATPHISMASLQPGDLVFPSNPADHVAMYVGNGNIIEAPHSGAVVHIVPLSGWFVLASRP